jgi:hypothetical protein
VGPCRGLRFLLINGLGASVFLDRHGEVQGR